MPIIPRLRKRKAVAATYLKSTTASTDHKPNKKARKNNKPQQARSLPGVVCGTSGYSYSHWRGLYFPRGYNASSKQWEYYSNEFDAVELNAPFYRWFERETWQSWRDKAEKASSSKARQFVFAIKAHQYFTHWRQLTVDAAFVEKFTKFIEDCRVLGKHCGPLLLQFPARFKCNDTTLARLILFGKLVQDMNHGNSDQEPLRVSLEFRHCSWFQSNVYEVFKQYNLCICLVHLMNQNPAKWADSMMSGFSPKLEDYPFGFCDWGIYARFHGSTGQYEGSYDDKVLDDFLKKCQGQKLFVFFNNTDDGDPPSAIRDARYVCRTSR